MLFSWSTGVKAVNAGKTLVVYYSYTGNCRAIVNHERSKDCNIFNVRLLNNQNIKNGIVQIAVFAKHGTCMCIFPSDAAAYALA